MQNMLSRTGQPGRNSGSKKIELVIKKLKSKIEEVKMKE